MTIEKLINQINISKDSNQKGIFPINTLKYKNISKEKVQKYNHIFIPEENSPIQDIFSIRKTKNGEDLLIITQLKYYIKTNLTQDLIEKEYEKVKNNKY